MISAELFSSGLNHFYNDMMINPYFDMSFDTRSTMAFHIFNLFGARLCVACARTPAIFPVGDSGTLFQVENCTWIHAAMVYNGQELQLYLDGEEQVTNVALSGMSTNSTPEAIVNFL